MNQQYETGKLPPQCVDIEQIVLGALLLEQNAFEQVEDILKPESFYKPAHGIIYAAITELNKKGEPADMATIARQLIKSGNLEKIGGVSVIMDLTSRVASSANINAHAALIAQEAIKRDYITSCADIIKAAYDPGSDIFELAEMMISGLKTFDMMVGGKQPRAIAQLASESLQALNMRNSLPTGQVHGVHTGFMELDMLTSGWQKTDLVIIGGRPSMGKTALAIHFAMSAARTKKRVFIASLEMSEIQLTDRMIMVDSEVDGERYKTGRVDRSEIEQVNYSVGRIEQLPIFIDDTPAASIYQVRSKAKRLKAKHGVDLIIVDYLQLMTADAADQRGSRKNGNREQEISAISRGLKAMAKELNVPVIALSQLNRANESRKSDNRPILSDLRESGAIEQDADMVIFPHRPEYYGINTDANGESTSGKCEIIIAKHRNGRVGSVNVKFIDRLTKFVDPKYQYPVMAGITPNVNFQHEPKKVETEEDPF